MYEGLQLTGLFDKLKDTKCEISRALAHPLRALKQDNLHIYAWRRTELQAAQGSVLISFWRQRDLTLLTLRR